MNIRLYKKAMDDIVVNPELIHDTAGKMRMVQQNKKPRIKRYAVMSCLAAVIAGALLLPGIEPVITNTSPNLEGEMVSPDHEKDQSKATAPGKNITLDRIAKYYVPFEASDYHSTKLKAPDIPLSYGELKQRSDIIVLGTISDVGVYSKKDNPLNSELSLNLANYIYTVEIDKVLDGNMLESEGSFIAAGEMAIAYPKSREHEDQEIDWSFRPYSFRPEAVQSIEAGEQYVLFLSEKDNTEVYRLSWDGFGIFSIDYINEEASKNSLSELQMQYEVEEVSHAPMENNLLYRLCSLYVNGEFLQ